MLIYFADDGPHNYTASILDVLKQKNSTATFFINGINYMNIYTPRAQAIIRQTISEVPRYLMIETFA